MKHILAIAALFAPVAAHAQGAPPFDLGSAGSSSQIVEMDLSIHDAFFYVGTGQDETITAFTGNEVSVVRDQLGSGAKAGELDMVPAAITPFQPLVPESDTRHFHVTASPPPDHVDIGEFSYELSCEFCSPHLEGDGSIDPRSIRSEAQSSFAVPAAVLAVRARASTPDYGYSETIGLARQTHLVAARASAGIGDWIYVTGAGPTATLVVTAPIEDALDAPDSTANGSGPSSWVTQAYGDVRHFGECDGPVLSQIDFEVDQRTRFSLDFALRDSWFFEAICEDDGEGGEICTQQWTSNLAGTASTARQHDMIVDVVGPNDCGGLVATDTGSLPASLTLQADVATNQWIQLEAVLQVESRCGGAMACDLTARSDQMTQLSITSPNGGLVAWHGIAGLTRVPEPGEGASVGVTLTLLSWLARRRAAQERN